MLPTTKTPPRSKLADLTVLIYGLPKIGKSTWCSKSEGALFLATEPGLNSLEVYQVPIASWAELLAACAEIAKGEHEFKTVILDTVDNAYRMCADHINAKFKVEYEGDLEYGKGWALIRNEFQRVLTKLASLPSGLFLVSHAEEKEVQTATKTYTRIKPTLPDKARKIIVGMADMILYCDVETSVNGEGKSVVQRVMRTKPSAYYEAGDRTGRLPDTIPLDFGEFIKAFENGEPKTAESVARGLGKRLAAAKAHDEAIKANNQPTTA
jgi:hypothetical protein